MRLSTRLSLTLVVICVPATNAQEVPSGRVELDHIILAITNLELGIREFARRTGVMPELGGENRARGTHNALVSLGPQRYLEIVAPISAQPDSTLTNLLSKKELTPFNWALRTRDIAGLVALLRARGFAVSDPRSGSRVRPDGTIVTWQLARLQDSTLSVAPFFIQWSAASPHPGSTSPSGCRLADLHLVERRVERLSLLLTTLGFQAHVDAGQEPRLTFSLLCSHGAVSFGQ